MYRIIVVFVTVILVSPVNANTDGMSVWPRDGVAVGAYKLLNPDSRSIKLEKYQEQMHELKSLGFDYAWADVWGLPKTRKLQQVLDCADKIGLFIVPHLNCHVRPLRKVDSNGLGVWKSPPEGMPPPHPKLKGTGIYGIGEKNWAQRWKDGSIAYGGTWRGHPYPCPDMWAPEARKYFRQTVNEAVDMFSMHPCVRAFSFEDEYRYWEDYFNKGRGLPIYSPWSRKAVSALSDYEGMPSLPLREPGYIADGNDPFLRIRYTIDPQFVRFSMSNRSIDFHTKDLSHVLHGRSKGISGFFTTGAFGAETDIVLARAYSNARNDPILNDAFSYDFAVAKSQGRSNMFVLLGWWDEAHDWPCYDNRIQKSARLTLIRGPNSIAFASASDMLHSDTMRRELVAAIDDIKQFGPMFRRIKLKPERIGLLWSDTTVSYQQVVDLGKWKKMKKKGNHYWRQEEHEWAVSHVGYPALCRAGFVPRVITEQDVLNGVLDELDILVLINHQYSESRLMREYNKFAQNGGLVLADKSSAVKPPRSLVIDFDASQERRAYEQKKRNWWSPDEKVHIAKLDGTLKFVRDLSEKIRKVLIRKYRTQFQKNSSNGIVISTLAGSGSKYMVAINADRDLKHTSMITFNHTGPIYDLVNNGKKLSFEQNNTGKCAVKLTLGPKEWAVWLLADCEMKKARALMICDENPVVIRCQLWDNEGFPMKGVVPFAIRTPRNTYWSSAEHGTGDVWIWDKIQEKDEVVLKVFGKEYPVHRMPKTAE